MKKTFLIVIGTRPEAIKMAPLIIALKKSDKFNVKVCSTGQHDKLLLQVLKIFEIKLDYNLRLLKNNQTLSYLSSQILIHLEKVISKLKPDLVFVHGDTTTSFIASLATFYQKIEVCHIESGLRTFNKYSPWPEEINRQLTARISSIHFAPTSVNVNNLLNENIPKYLIHQVGNTVIDSLFFCINKIENNLILENKILKSLNKSGLSNNIFSKSFNIILVTIHRRENFGAGIINICKVLERLMNENSNLKIIIPLHPNPNVRLIILHYFNNSNHKNILLIEPLDYLPFIYVMNKSFFIMTDSGGVQEEAPSLGKPVLVLRNTTERIEAVKSKSVILVGTDFNKVYKASSKLLTNKIFYNSFRKIINPYGSGNTSDKILKVLFRKYKISKDK